MFWFSFLWVVCVYVCVSTSFVVEKEEQSRVDRAMGRTQEKLEEGKTCSKYIFEKLLSTKKMHFLTLSPKIVCLRGWRDGLSIKGTGCFSRGSGLIPSTQVEAPSCNSSVRSSNTFFRSLVTRHDVVHDMHAGKYTHKWKTTTVVDVCLRGRGYLKNTLRPNWAW